MSAPHRFGSRLFSWRHLDVRARARHGLVGVATVLTVAAIAYKAAPRSRHSAGSMTANEYDAAPVARARALLDTRSRECDCVPLWTCMQSEDATRLSPGDSRGCVLLEQDLRLCMSMAAQLRSGPPGS
ncbi:hypothetical protein FVE85_3358 [Porphyridium purpureum]|uniref:Uncharacterized protein n=1 Tax=Porphyridium purpureum TaxID=35688 RepID=A0A5J4YXC6_PORPP|nr:hypothetical protein FVE85_3358 [Porphyridium purpureum]|eukprot:POR3008..scf227_4